MSKVYVPRYPHGSDKDYLGKENNVIGKINRGEKEEKRTGDSPLLPNPKRTIHPCGIQSWHSRSLRRAFMNSPNNKREDL